MNSLIPPQTSPEALTALALAIANEDWETAHDELVRAFTWDWTREGPEFWTAEATEMSNGCPISQTAAASIREMVSALERVE
jgi:hypothetical protein